MKIEFEPDQEQQYQEYMWQERLREAACEFLVEGLESDRFAVQERCIKVLTALGWLVAVPLTLIITHGHLSFGTTDRIIRVITAVSGFCVRSPDANAQLLRCILFLIRKNEIRAVEAGLALSVFMPRHSLTNLLVDEALNHKSEGRYFDRLLQAVEIVNEVPSEEQCLQLLRIYGDQSHPRCRSCRRLINKINRREIGGRPWFRRFRKRHLANADLCGWPDEDAIPNNLFPELSDPVWVKEFLCPPSPALPGTN